MMPRSSAVRPIVYILRLVIASLSPQEAKETKRNDFEKTLDCIRRTSEPDSCLLVRTSFIGCSSKLRLVVAYRGINYDTMLLTRSVTGEWHNL
jgi:hypothetical protein